MNCEVCSKSVEIDDGIYDTEGSSYAVFFCSHKCRGDWYCSLCAAMREELSDQPTPEEGR